MEESPGLTLGDLRKMPFWQYRIYADRAKEKIETRIQQQKEQQREAERSKSKAKRNKMRYRK